MNPSRALCRRLTLVGIREHGLAQLLAILPLSLDDPGSDLVLQLTLDREPDGSWYAGYRDLEVLDSDAITGDGKTLADAVAALILDMKDQKLL